MHPALRWLFGSLIAVLLVGGPIAYSNYRQAQLRGLRVVKDGVLYRSGQMTLPGLKEVIRDYQIKTVISLRFPKIDGEQPPDLQEEMYCRSQDIEHRRIKLDCWWASDGTVPAEKGVRQLLEIMDDPARFPVLIHCFAGAHRTGACCAIYRMEYEHWPNAAAIAEMKQCGYWNIDYEFDLLGYLENYRPRWKNHVSRPSNPGTLPNAENRPSKVGKRSRKKKPETSR